MNKKIIITQTSNFLHTIDETIIIIFLKSEKNMGCRIVFIYLIYKKYL